MKFIKKMLCIMISLVLVLSVSSPMQVSAQSKSKSMDSYIGELIAYYRDYQEKADTDILRILDEIKKLDEEKYKAWNEIVAFWKQVNQPNFTNVNVLPDGLAQDDSLCIVILGFALNSDGSMKQELIKRLEVGLNAANKYPNAYVVVTGGGTAASNPNVTEGGLMGQWLLEHGLSSERLIVENKAPDTVGNAKNTYKILNEKYPQVKSLVMVTSDYHVPRGSILFFTQCLLSAYELGNEPLKMVSNAGCYTGSLGYESLALQAKGIAQIAQVKLPSKVNLSQLNGLKISQEKPYQANQPLNLKVLSLYNTNYSRDVSEWIKIENFDPLKGQNQIIKIIYTENNVTISTDFDLSTTNKTVYDNTYLQELIHEVEAKDLSAYTKASVSKLQQAISHAKDVIQLGQNATKEQLDAAYVQINEAINGLVKLVNIAYKMNVSTNCNQANAYKINNGIKSKSDYWESKNNDQNVASKDAELIIDLDGVYELENITVYPYWGGQRIYQYEIYGSTDQNEWVKIGENRSNAYVTSEGISHDISNKEGFSHIKLKGIKTRVSGRDDINNIHIVELEVFGHEKNNLAYLKPITSSGTDTSAGSSANSKDIQIVDGNRSTYWDAGDYAKNPWITVDLKDVYLIDRVNLITFWSRNDRYYYYDIYTSQDGIDYSLAYSKSSGNEKATIFGDTINFENPIYARYVKVVGKYNSKNSAFHINELRVYGNEVTQLADYTKVDKAISKVPSDLSLYTEVSVNKLQEAINAVVRDQKIYNQAIVDSYATNIENAISQLDYKLADYTKVDKAISKVPSDLSLYTEVSVNKLQEAINAVVRDLNITKQKEVDEMANMIDLAINQLEKINQDDSTIVDTFDDSNPMYYIGLFITSLISIIILKKRHRSF